MQIAVIDDQEADRRDLIHMLSRYFESSKVGAACDEYCSGESFLESFHPGKYELVFIDIYMDKINGMDVARRIHQDDVRCRLIFYTTSHTHAVESYDVKASYYLTKPLPYSRLCCALNSCCQDLLEENRYLCVNVGKAQCKLLFRDIWYVYSVSRNTHIQLKDKELVIKDAISGVIAILMEDDRFLCCNRNFIINMDYVECAMDDFFLMKNNDRIPIRQRGKSAAKKMYLNYSLKNLRKEDPYEP